MFVLGTSTVVAYIPTDQIDLIGPLPQVLRAGFGPFGIASTARHDRDPDDARHARRAERTSRSPRSHGFRWWPGGIELLPPWFSRLHPRIARP